LLDWAPDWQDPTRTMKLVQAKNVLSDTGPGPLKFDSPHQPRPRTSARLRYMLSTRQEMLNAREFVRDTVQGKRNTFWIPLWSLAFHATDTIGDTDTTFDITRSGYTLLYGGVGYGREHLAFFPRVAAVAQTLVARKIESSVENPLDGTETITISSAVGHPVTTKDLIAFLLLVRLDTDSPVLEYHEQRDVGNPSD
jgi:hypothetical protein